MNRRRRSGKRRLVAGGLIALVSLVVVELVLRLVGMGPTYRTSEVLGWHLSPNLEAAEFHGAPEPHQFHVSSNEDGIRNAGPREPIPGRFRVVVLGDSVPFGWGVEDGESLVAATQARLNEDSETAGRFELINAAQSAFSTEQIGRLYETVIRHYEPDLVVVFLPLHDHHLVVLSDQRALGGGGGVALKARSWLLRHARIYTGLRRILRPQERAAPFVLPKDALLSENGAQTHKDSNRVPRVADARRGQLLDGMHERLAEQDAALALGFLPIFPDDVIGDAGIPQPGEAWAREFAGSRGLDIVDLKEACRGGGADSVFSFDQGHFTPGGNVLIGKKFADWLLEGSRKESEIP